MTYAKSQLTPGLRDNLEARLDYIEDGVATVANGGSLAAIGDINIQSDTDVSGAGDIIFSTSGAEQGRITAGGRWGIGTNNPQHRLHFITSKNTERVIQIDHTYATTLGAGSLIPLKVNSTLVNYTATDAVAPLTPYVAALRATINYGGATGTAAATGTAISSVTEMIVTNNGDANNEPCTYFGVLRDDHQGATQPRLWFGDYSLHGPVGQQPALFSGITMFGNNYYNGTHLAAGSAALINVTTLKGSGGSTTSLQTGADTYPIDAGITITGKSTAAAVDHDGFTTALQIGGNASGWNPGSSMFGTGISIRDYRNTAIAITTPAAGGTPIGMSIANGAGPLLVGRTSAGFATTVFEATGPGTATKDPLFAFTDAGAFGFTVRIGNTVGSHRIFMCGGAGDFITGTAIGDAGIYPVTAAKAFHLSGTTKLFTFTQDNKIGFFAATPIVKFATTGTATGFTAGAGTAVTHLSTFTGNNGATAYTIGDLVLALKNYGLLTV